MLFLGCDGGSTKFDYVVSDEQGACITHQTFPGINLVQDGMEDYARGIRAQVDALGIDLNALTRAAFGVTGYGESRTAARDMNDAVQIALGHDRCTVSNDSVTGWSGALALAPGICVSAGTGSVAYGQDRHGNGARAGGWSLRFGDEGSAHWIAMRAANLFYRQADGRLPKSQLYAAFMREFDLQDPIHFSVEFEDTYAKTAADLAAFQRKVLALCYEGDPQVIALYRQAGGELAQLVQALLSRLDFADTPVKVAYTGGLFNAGEFLIEPFSQAVQALGATVVKPIYTPVVGAVGYAAKPYLRQEALHTLMENLASTI
ncbi:MAG TPA: BadF/BadG/BcrA/BcrD ATPase family protein [Candidatus Limiplasma sp.]|nr:BadF/BadG/BcrA/BcrD ATPase family protein [Candidatus Limiplasma sp.]